MTKKKKAAPAPGAAQYRVVVGLNYPTPEGEKRAEPGDVVDDLPAEAVEGPEGLLAQGAIVPEEG